MAKHVPKMLIEEIRMAAPASIFAVSSSAACKSSRPPTAVMPEMALVTDISGVCSACATPQTAW